MIETVVRSAFCALILGALARAQSAIKIGETHTLSETDNGNADFACVAAGAALAARGGTVCANVGDNAES